MFGVCLCVVCACLRVVCMVCLITVSNFVLYRWNICDVYRYGVCGVFMVKLGCVSEMS